MLKHPSIFKTILLSSKGAIANVTLNRPRVGNRANKTMVEDLSQAVELINQDVSIGVVTLTGARQTFSSGWEQPCIRAGNELAQYQAATVISRILKPVVAAINGDAIGQGLEIAMAADIRIAISTAQFGMPQVKYGFIPWDGGTQRLPRIIGRAHALELLLTGSVVNAAEALRMGLVNRVAEPKHFQSTVDHLTQHIARTGRLAASYAKEGIMNGMELTLPQSLRLEADLSLLLQSTHDRSEGIRSFLERRPPGFQDK